MKTQELRIGICDCSPTYHGKLNGKILRLGQASFKLKEISIDDQNSAEETYRHRCHFTLDMHSMQQKNKEMKHSFILRNDRMNSSSTRRRLIAGDLRQCLLPEPVKIETILRWATDLLAEMPERQRVKWLAQ